jgi:DNA-binding CsgD family transcriptional regulator
MHKDFKNLPPIRGLKKGPVAVAHLLIQDYSRAEMAKRLCLSSRSIKKYILDLKEAMDCQTLHGLSAQLMRLSLEQALREQASE